MYVTRIPNRDSPPAVLLRESYREGGKVKSRTLANISDWPEAKIESLRRVLAGETLVPLAPSASRSPGRWRTAMSPPRSGRCAGSGSTRCCRRGRSAGRN